MSDALIKQAREAATDVRNRRVCFLLDHLANALELERPIKLGEVMVAIAERNAGELPRTWHQSTEQDKWQVAFSAGLLAAIEEIRIAQREV